jgi:4-azaleucine resistance transporter AzlC
MKPMKKSNLPANLNPDTSSTAFDLSGMIIGMQKSIPFSVSVFAYSFIFGILSRQAGLSIAEAGLMSSLVYAGASQFVAIGIWSDPLPVAAIIFATFVVNLRHLLMGISISPLLMQLRPALSYGSLFFMVDESWAIKMAEWRQGKCNAAILLGSGLMLFVTWVSATLLGHMAGSVVQDPRLWGLDFAFNAVFIGISVGFWKGKSNILPWLVAALVSVTTAKLLPGKWYILFGSLAGSLIGWMSDAD